jgi:hypothetical protein
MAIFIVLAGQSLKAACCDGRSQALFAEQAAEEL